MNLIDILELAKQGYKPNDIKELIELSKESEQESTDQGDAPGDGGESDHTTLDKSKPTDTDTDDDSIDYKALYEAEHEKLLNAQKNNVNQNLNSNTKSDEEVVTELFRMLK